MKNYRDSDRKGFTLLEVLVAIAVFALIITAAAGTFASMQTAWRKQRNTIDLVQNARWALEFMTNEIRGAGVTTININGPGTQLTFQIDPNADGNPPFRTIRYRRIGNTLRRRQLSPPVTPEQELLANFIVVDAINNLTGLPPPDGIADQIFNNAAGLLTLRLTVRPRPGMPVGPGNRDYTLRTRVRVRN